MGERDTRFDDPVEVVETPRKKREKQNIYLALIIGFAGLACAGLLQNVIPAVVGIGLAIFIYRRDA